MSKDCESEDGEGLNAYLFVNDALSVEVLVKLEPMAEGESAEEESKAWAVLAALVKEPVAVVQRSWVLDDVFGY
jgi:hypothetical protein